MTAWETAVCCREWPVAVGWPIRRCGYCGQRPTTLVRLAQTVRTLMGGRP